MKRNKKILKGLSAAQYEHPFDKAALSTLKRTPGLTQLGNYINSHTIERLYTIQHTGSGLKITKESYPELYEYMEYACEILDVDKVPDFYLQWNYDINGITIGSENPIIVLNSGVFDLCDDDEIMFIIGHELGHIKSKHTLYHMMAQVIGMVIDLVPFGNIASAPFQYALYYWNRMSEFTCDRAGLLCCQNKQAAVKAFMKMAGMPIKLFDKMNTESFIEQARNFKMLDYSALNTTIKTIAIADDTHPWTVMRASELLKWIDANEKGYKLTMEEFNKTQVQITSIKDKLKRIK